MVALADGYVPACVSVRRVLSYQANLFVIMLLGKGWGLCEDIWKAKCALLQEEWGCWMLLVQAVKLAVWLYPGPEPQDTCCFPSSLIEELWTDSKLHLCVHDTHGKVTDPCCVTGQISSDSLLWQCRWFWVSLFVVSVSSSQYRVQV